MRCVLQLYFRSLNKFLAPKCGCGLKSNIKNPLFKLRRGSAFIRESKEKKVYMLSLHDLRPNFRSFLQFSIYLLLQRKKTGSEN